jgi:dihydrofolate reductase
MSSGRAAGQNGMGNVTLDITISLDGFVAGPNASLDEPLGEDGMQLHNWVFGLATWRESQGLEGGERGLVDDLVRERIQNAGAVIMGRKMFSGGSGPWEADPMADGWWGDEPPFRVPVFVLTHHARETVTHPNGTKFVFVTDGIESALAHAREAAGGKDVGLAGGASAAREYLAAGVVDELQIHIAPLLLGGGVRLFDELAAPVELELTHAFAENGTTHLGYRVVRA